MSFTENLKVEIESLLDAKGFKQLEKNVAKAKAEMQSVNQAFNQADGLRNFRNQVQNEAGKVRQEAEQMGRVLEEAGLEEAPEGLSANFLDPRQSASGNIFEQQIPDQEAINRIKEAQDRLSNARGGAGSMFGGQIRATGDSVGSAQRAGGPMAEVQNMDTPEIRKFSLFRRVLYRVASASRFASANMNRLAFATSKASAGFSALTGRAMTATSAIRSQIPSLQQLQMQLLGVQFSLMALAFIFGGLMMGALGAVGVFEILGNTLKMFFLPAALELLPAVMDIRDALLGIDEDTRKSIGRIFMIIAAIGALGSILAFTASGIIGLLKGLLMIGKFLWAVGGAVKWVLAKMLGLGKFLIGPLKTAFGIITGSLGAALSFLGGLAAGFLSVVLVAKKFGKKVALVFGTILAVIAGVAAAILAVISAPVWAIAALIGVVVGAIMGIIWTFRDSIIGAFNWIVNSIIGIFEWLWNVLVGNSIVPDMVKGIVDSILSIPGKIVNLGKNIVNTIVNGIKSMGGAIWSAFKKVMPDFLVDAIEGAGKAVSNAVGTVGDFAGGAVDAAGNFVSGVGNTVSNLNPFAGNNNNGGTTVQNNNINANVEVNDKEETPQETGRQFGRGAAQSMNSRQSNFSNGT